MRPIFDLHGLTAQHLKAIKLSVARVSKKIHKDDKTDSTRNQLTYILGGTTDDTDRQDAATG